MKRNILACKFYNNNTYNNLDYFSFGIKLCVKICSNKCGTKLSNDEHI